VLEIVMPVWSGAEDAGELSVESLSRIPHPTLALAEANTVFQTAFHAVRDRLPRCTTAILPGGKLKHFTGLEHPALILEHMKAFLQPDAVPSVLEGV
jgi:hypothetical protein